MSLNRCQNRGGFLMIHAVISKNRIISVCEMVGRYDSSDYCELIKNKFLPVLRVYLEGNEFIWQQENASIHTAKKSQEFFKNEKIEVLSWPVKSPGLNPVENWFAELAHRVYRNNKQCDFIDQLWSAIEENVALISSKFYENFYASIPSRLTEVLIKNSG